MVEKASSKVTQTISQILCEDQKSQNKLNKSAELKPDAKVERKEAKLGPVMPLCVARKNPIISSKAIERNPIVKKSATPNINKNFDETLLTMKRHTEKPNVPRAEKETSFSKMSDWETSSTLKLATDREKKDGENLELIEENQRLKASVGELRTEICHLRALLSARDEAIKNYQKYVESPNLLLDESVTYFRGQIKLGVKQGFCEEIVQETHFTGFYLDGEREGEGTLVTPKFRY